MIWDPTQKNSVIGWSPPNTSTCPLTDNQTKAVAAVTDAQKKLTDAIKQYKMNVQQCAVNDDAKQDVLSLQNSYIYPTQAAMQTAVQECLDAGTYLEALRNLAGPNAQYVSNLQQQAERLVKEQSQLSQKIRTQRRSFLDTSPQSGTGGYLFHHTADDAAMIALLVGFVIAYYFLVSNVIPAFPYKQPVSILLFFAAWFGVNQIVLRLA